MALSVTRVALLVISGSLATAMGGCGGAPVGGESTGSGDEAYSGIPYSLIEYPETNLGSGVDTITQQNLVSTPTELFYSDPWGGLMWKHYDNLFKWQDARPVAIGGLHLAGTPSAVVTDVNEWRVFLPCFDGSFWYVDYLGGNWLKPQMIGPPGTILAKTSVSATHDYWSGQWRVYFVGQNSHVYETSYTSGPWWSGGRDIGAVTNDAPSAVLRHDGQLNVFFRGTNGHLFDSWFDGSSWHAPWDHGIAITTDPEGIASPDDSRIDVYYTVPATRWSLSQLGSTTWTSAYGWGGGATHGVVLYRASARKADDVFGFDANGHVTEAHATML